MDSRGSATPSPTGDAPVRSGVDGGDNDTNKDGGGAVAGSIGSDGGAGRVFYSREE